MNRGLAGVGGVDVTVHEGPRAQARRWGMRQEVSPHVMQLSVMIDEACWGSS